MRGMKWHHLGKKITEKYPKGQGMVEFALVLPLLLVLMFGIIELGRLIFIYSAVYTASREAARYGSAAGMSENGIERYKDKAAMEAAARRVGIMANITDVRIGYDSGGTKDLLTAQTVQLAPYNRTIGGTHRVVAVVTADYQPIVPLVNIPPLQVASWSARTILNKFDVGVEPAPSLYISVLEGCAANIAPNKWDAHLTVKLLDNDGNLPQGVVGVIFSWVNHVGHREIQSCEVNDGTDYCDLNIKQLDTVSLEIEGVDYPNIIGLDEASSVATSITLSKTGVCAGS